MSATAAKKPKSRFWLVFPFLVLAAIIVVWTAYWFIARDQLDKGIDDWIATERARGATVDYTDKTLGGFPFRFELTVSDPQYQPLGAPLWQGQELRLVMQPWNWQHVIGFAPGRNVVTEDDGTRHVATLGDKSAMSLSWTEDGINRVGLQIDDAEAIVEGETYAARGFSLNLAPRPETLETLMVAVQWEEVKINATPTEAAFLGDTLGPSRLIGEIREFFPAMELAGGDIARLQEALIYREGGVEVAQLVLNWGPMDLGVKGDVGFSAGKANGSVSLRLDNADALRAAMDEAGQLDFEQQAVLGMIEASSKDGGFLKLDIREDEVFFGPARIGALP